MHGGVQEVPHGSWSMHKSAEQVGDNGHVYVRILGVGAELDEGGTKGSGRVHRMQEC